MEAANSLTGSIIAERYQLVELLGAGGSGSTYRAIRLSDQIEVAIKILSLRHLNDWKQLELFEREAKVLAQLSHPQIPQYLEYFHVDTPENRAFYIVQQLAPGKPLSALVQSGWRGTKTEVRDIASQLLTILQYLHQQSPPLIHRDIKPHNIIRNNDGQVFLVDFGAVQDVYHNTLMKGSTVAGTYGYMAPEQFRGAAVPASDLYGLGATVLYLLTHRSPADLPQARLKLSFRSHVNIADHFADWLEVMLEPDTADRFSSATAALSALQKKHRFRLQRGAKVGFPWAGAIVAVAISIFTIPLIHQYRYAFLTVIGLQPRDLCTAIQNNDLTPLNEYLNHGGSVNANVTINENTFTPEPLLDAGSLLHCAIEHKQTEIVEDLLRRGADPNAQSKQGMTPLHRVVKVYHKSNNYPDSTKVLTGLKSEVEQSTNHMIKAVDVNCLRRDASDILRLLIDYKANMEAKDDNGESPLLFAVKLQNYQTVETLIKLGADPHTTNRNQSSLWHVLAWYKYPNANRITTNNLTYSENTILRIAQQLTAAKVDINTLNNNGDTALYSAMQSNNFVVAEYLLSHKINSGTWNTQGQTPLTAAVISKNSEMTKLLLLNGADVNAVNQNGNTPLIEAIKINDFSEWSGFKNLGELSVDKIDKTRSAASNAGEISSILLSKDANPNLVDRDGNTPLHFLGRFNNRFNSSANDCIRKSQDSLSMKLLDLLVRHHADPQAVNKNGDTALHIAASQDYFNLTRRMIGYGWKPLQKNHAGEDALSIAANNYGIPIDKMRIILSSNNKSNLINIPDKDGNTMLHLAVLGKLSQSNDSVSRMKNIKLLANAGARFDIKNKLGQTALNILPLTTNIYTIKKFDSADLTIMESTKIVRELVWKCQSESDQAGGQ
jgi:serine/threonine protein kinase